MKQAPAAAAANDLPLSHITLSVCDPSLTLTQFCTHLKSVILLSIQNTSIRDSSGCKDHCNNTNLPTYWVLTNLPRSKQHYL